MNNEELDILIQRRTELIEYVLTHDLQKELHYMKFLELQDVNLEIIKIQLDYDFTNDKVTERWSGLIND